MATETPVRILDSNESNKWLPTVDPGLFSSPFSNVTGHEGFTEILKGSGIFEEQNSMVPNRSGSAPPTVEGSIAAFRTFIDQRNSTLTNSRSDFLDYESEEQMRTNPAYIAYYYANVNLNPRLPPPLISRENRHLGRLIGGFASKKVSVTEGLLPTHKEEPDEDMSHHQILDDQKEILVVGTTRASLAGHDMSVADLLEADVVQAEHETSTTVKGENDHDINTVSTNDQMLKVQEPCSSSTDAHVVNFSASISNVLTNPASSHLRMADSEDDVSTQSNYGSDISVIESRIKSLDASSGLVTEDNRMRHDNQELHDYNRLPGRTLHHVPYLVSGPLHGRTEKLATVHPKLLPTQPFMHNPGLVSPLYSTPAAYVNPANLVYSSQLQPGLPNAQFPLGGFNPSAGFHHPPFGGFPYNDAFPLQTALGFFKPPVEALRVEMNPYTSQMHYLSRHYAQHEVMRRPSLGGPFQGQYFQPSFEDAQRSAVQQSLASRKDSDVASSRCDEEHILATGRFGISSPIPSPVNLSHIGVRYYGYPPSLGIPQFPAHSLSVPGSPIGGNHPGLGNDPSASQYSPGSAAEFSGWKAQKGPDSSDSSKGHSFLELLKSCSSRKLELSDISGQIVDFSTDQHGSRFIQQKLEHCSSNEKEFVFKEVLPHASKLMTDVFGNYVIQKFFEHGTIEQRRKLGEQLNGQILTLSLQMYGCRVIQKALEVIELDQKVELVQELDGHVMRCVHDQNGNHVIQKCIESVPVEKSRFIITSFNGQVATLSSHPYGCRVIQRVLEHCSDEQISCSMLNEILAATCTLAQDPYGNYVTQHILEMGKPHERGEIIQKLAGKFVQMSQHKYASNVVEKCLKYGDALERDLIIEEFVAQSDSSDALLAMMKDQFANYVVQKIFDMGNEKQKDILLKCIQTHLPVLKRFTYAKQIVARYELLAETSFSEKT